MEERLRTVEIADGRLEVGLVGSGEPVVVIQTALDIDELRPVGREIARGGRHRVLHCHRRGYGASSAVRGETSMAGEAADVAAVIEALDVAPAHVVGVSFSAAVALCLASGWPGLVRTLTVVEAPPTGTASAGEFLGANRRLLERWQADGTTVALREFLAMLGEEDSGGVSERDAATFFGSDVPALLSWSFGSTEAAGISCPVLYVGGGASGEWFTQMRDRLLALLPHVESASVEGAGHLVACTHPAAVAALVIEHVDE